MSAGPDASSPSIGLQSNLQLQRVAFVQFSEMLNADTASYCLCDCYNNYMRYAVIFSWWIVYFFYNLQRRVEIK